MAVGGCGVGGCRGEEFVGGALDPAGRGGGAAVTVCNYVCTYVLHTV